MRWFIKKLKYLQTHRVLLHAQHISYIFLVLNIIGFFSCDNKHEVMARTVMIFLFPSFVFLFQQKGVATWIIIYAYALFFFRGITSYAPIIMISLVITYFSLNRNFKIWLSIPYIALVGIVATLHNASPFRIILHISTCCVIFYIIPTLFSKVSKETKIISLIITPEETQILDCLLDGYEISEITLYSRNTIFKKLKQARERNFLKDNEELISLYEKIKRINSKREKDIIL